MKNFNFWHTQKKIIIRTKENYKKNQSEKINFQISQFKQSVY